MGGKRKLGTSIESDRSEQATRKKRTKTSQSEHSKEGDTSPRQVPLEAEDMKPTPSFPEGSIKEGSPERLLMFTTCTTTPSLTISLGTVSTSCKVPFKDIHVDPYIEGFMSRSAQYREAFPDKSALARRTTKFSWESFYKITDVLKHGAVSTFKEPEHIHFPALSSEDTKGLDSRFLHSHLCTALKVGAYTRWWQAKCA